MPLGFFNLHGIHQEGKNFCRENNLASLNSLNPSERLRSPA
jgi:hypothetical protein